MDGSRTQDTGYATDLTTDKALAWLDERDDSKPFFLMCQHKAPHRTFAPALRHLDAFDDVEIPEPETLFDQYMHQAARWPRMKWKSIDTLIGHTDAKVRKDERGDVSFRSRIVMELRNTIG